VIGSVAEDWGLWVKIRSAPMAASMGCMLSWVMLAGEMDLGHLGKDERNFTS
jgi:hypothetical protein